MLAGYYWLWAWFVWLNTIKSHARIVDDYRRTKQADNTAATAMTKTRRRREQPSETTGSDCGWRIIIRAYDTTSFSHDLAREIRLVTGRSRWEACQITAGIVAGYDEMCLIDGLDAGEAERAVTSLSAAGFMARRELDDGAVAVAASVPRMRTVLSGLVRR